MATVLGLDIGTTKLCALALSVETGEALAVRSAPNDADISPLPHDRHEQDPVRIRDRCFELVRAVAADGAVVEGDVGGIGLSGQMHGVLLVGGERPAPCTDFITWRDQRGHGDGDEAVERCGCRLHPGYGGATLGWMVENGCLPAGARALSAADYVAGCLSGCYSSEPTHGASWGLLDVRAGQWDRERVEALGIPEEALPELRPSCRPLGALLPDMAKALGLPGEVQVCAPVGDNQASVIGAAGFADDTAVLNLGTGGQISVFKGAYAFREGLETRPMPLGGYLLVGASLCGGWAYAYLRRFIQDTVRAFGGAAPGDEAVYARMNELALETAPGAAGLMADTRFSGQRGRPEIRGALEGIDRENLTPGNLVRAFAEGMVRELRDMASAAGLDGVGRILATGNAVRKNPAVPGIVEQLFGVPCEVGHAEEEAALGAARAAAAGLGLSATA
ncbi:MAG: hypothetical protein JXR94_02340 [Candidatus Hydrogenedentes bacterium]|nr:hypothetical protein [Candidatus Hydrogenedentota bacterium]